MKVKYVKGEEKRAKTPFVVGGVYLAKFGDDCEDERLLVRVECYYCMIHLRNGDVTNRWGSEKDVIYDLPREYTYIPNAVLHIPEEEQA